MEPLLVITNEDAGTAADEALDASLTILRESCSVEVASTSRSGELDGVLQRAGSRRIVVAGGDGSLHAVVAALHRRHDLETAVVGLLPMGTGNDFARTLGIPLDPLGAAQVIVGGHVAPVDLVVDELGEIVVNNVHIGAGAHASRRGARWKERLGRIGVGRANLGKLGYPIGALQSVFASSGVHLHVEVDGTIVSDLDRPVLMVSIGNGGHVGGGTELTPGADPSDGRVDVLISYAVSPAAKVGYALSLRRGAHHERDDVQRLRAREVAVSGDEFYLSADGELSGPERHRSWHVEPGAYSFILPTDG